MKTVLVALLLRAFSSSRPHPHNGSCIRWRPASAGELVSPDQELGRSFRFTPDDPAPAESDPVGEQWPARPSVQAPGYRRSPKASLPPCSRSFKHTAQDAGAAQRRCRRRRAEARSSHVPARRSRWQSRVHRAACRGFQPAVRPRVASRPHPGGRSGRHLASAGTTSAVPAQGTARATRQPMSRPISASLRSTSKVNRC